MLLCKLKFEKINYLFINIKMEIINYPNYLIYNDGRVYGKKNNKFLKLKREKSGYERIGLYSNGKRKFYFIHRLVAINYIPNPCNKPQVNHINGNKLDNRIENLEWVSNIENSNKYRNNTRINEFINIYKNKSCYEFTKIYYKKRIYKTFKTKIEAICYKYIIQLRIKAKHFD